MPSIGSERVGFHADADHDDAGVARRASEHTAAAGRMRRIRRSAGFSAGSKRLQRGGRRRFCAGVTGRASARSHGLRARGSTTISAPSFSASFSPRLRIIRRERSGAILSLERRDYGEATGPAGRSPTALVAADVLLLHGVKPTASGSVNAACSAASPFELPAARFAEQHALA